MSSKKIIAKKKFDCVLNGKESMNIAKELLTNHVKNSLDSLGDNFFVNEIAKKNAFTNLLYAFIDDDRELNSVILVEDNESSHYYTISLVAKEILNV